MTQNTFVLKIQRELCHPKSFGIFEKRAPGTHFSKVPKLFGGISVDIVLIVSSKRRLLEARNCSYFNLCSLYNIWKDQLYIISGSELYEWLFGPEKFSGLSRNRPLAWIFQNFLTTAYYSSDWKKERIERNCINFTHSFQSEVLMHELHVLTSCIYTNIYKQVIWWHNSEDWDEKF